MDKALYVGMSGASQMMRAQTVHANNLANVNTTGFRGDLVRSQAMQIAGEGMNSRVYAMNGNPGTDLRDGALDQTGNPLDIAVQDEGWISVLAADGTEAFTRAGDLRVSEFGELLTGNGLPVLGNNGPVVLPPHERIEIGSDGTISLRELGQGSEVLAMLDRIKLVNPENADLVKGQDGLMRREDGAFEPADGEVRVVSGYLEGSNVDAVSAMVDMISLSRRYEMNVRMMQTAQENSEASARLLQMQ